MTGRNATSTSVRGLLLSPPTEPKTEVSVTSAAGTEPKTEPKTEVGTEGTPPAATEGAT